MDEVRKNAYRNLLYRAMLDIRTLCQSRGPASHNLIEWHRQYHNSRAAGALADWLHNLAMYAAHDFKEFNEERFWKEFEGVQKRFSKYKFDYYRDVFDQFIQSSENGGIK